MGNLSIKLKLLVSSGFVILVSLIATTFVGLASMNSSSDQAKTMAGVALSDSVIEGLQEKANTSASLIASDLNSAFVVPLTLAKVLSETSIRNGGTPFARDQVSSLVRQFLVANPKVSAAYSDFEPNGYDGLDSQYVKSSFKHSNPMGALEAYWVREGDRLINYQVDDPNARYKDTKDEFGQRESEWYLCSRDSGMPCTIEPYLYEISEGQEVLMTTLTAPVMVKGHFQGVAGIDINLPVLQELATEIATDIGDGVQVHLLTPQNRLVASSHYIKHLNRPLAEADAKLAQILTQPSMNSEMSNFVTVSSKIGIEGSGTSWTLLIRQDKKIAMATLGSLNERLDQGLSSALMGMIETSAAAIILSILALSLLLSTIIKPMLLMAEQFNSLASNDGDLTNKIGAKSHKELNDMASGFNAFTDKLQTMINSIKVQSTNLDGESDHLSHTASLTRKATDKQKNDTESVAAAIEQMSATSSEVASLAEQVSGGANEAFEFLQHTKKVVEGSVVDIKELSSAMDLIAGQISQVSNQSENINSILETIRSIAEQTNLLALNAAIEAARAGEQGRGFAVVADEVRNLAARTQVSTTEIDELIHNLQADVATAVSQIQQGQSRANKTVGESEKSYQQLNEVTEKINIITSNVTQVATAAEEQSSVSLEISRHVAGIGESSNELSSLALEVDEVSDKLLQVVNKMNNELNTLKV